MKRTTRNAGITFCLCVLLLATSQKAMGQHPDVKTQRASQIAASVVRTIRLKEPRWSLKKSYSAGPAITQVWKSGGTELTLQILVYDSPEEASKELYSHGVFQVANSEKMEGFGEEARSISHPYFTWVGVRQGSRLAWVQGPGMQTTKRFAQYALAQLEDK